MIVDWKHRKAESEVEVLLRRAASLDPELVSTFPRPLEEILCASLAVSFESHRGLTARVVAEVLSDVYGVNDPEVLPQEAGPIAGFSYARGETAVVFTDTQYGDGFERFTIAHEASHLAVEYLPRLVGARQQSLFGDTGAPAFYARRDPPAHFFFGEDSAPARGSDLWAEYARLRADREAWLREVVANACAAELLTPHRELGRFLRSLPSSADHRAEVQTRFGLSRRAAEGRLADLGLAQRGDGGAQFLLG